VRAVRAASHLPMIGSIRAPKPGTVNLPAPGSIRAPKPAPHAQP
jgi:hypothetical protein